MSTKTPMFRSRRFTKFFCTVLCMFLFPIKKSPEIARGMDVFA